MNVSAPAPDESGPAAGPLPVLLAEAARFAAAEIRRNAARGFTGVSFPVPQKAAYVKFKNPASRFALVGVLVAKTPGGARVAVTGAAGSVFRATAIEQALNGNWSAAAAKAVKVSADNLNSDLHASAEYRAHLIPVLAARAVAAAG